MEVRRPRLLIVDDVPDNRELLARRFAQHGFDSVKAESGRSALRAIEAEPFDTVLLDVTMPDMDGLEALAKIRAQFSPAELPVIMVTGRAESTDVVKALTAGANDYVTKPIDFAVVQARVQAQVARKRAEDTLAHLVAQLELAVLAHFRQLKRDAAALADTDLDTKQVAIVESLKSSGSNFIRAVSKALDGGGREKPARSAA